ncbi:MAG: glycosyl hydrolase family 18 protein [Acetivibrionales bacterium]|jgi:spore germination protein YaaH
MKDKRLSTIAGALVLTLIAAGVLAVYLVRTAPNKKVVEPFDIPGTRLVIGGELIKDPHSPYIQNGQVYLPFETIKKHIDEYIWYDEALLKVTVTTRDRVIRMRTGSLDALINEKPMELKFPVAEKNGTIYLPIDFLREFYGISVSYVESNDVVIIDFNNKVYRTAWPLDAKTFVRRGPSIYEPIVKKYIGQGEKGLDIYRTVETSLIVFDESEEWYRVRANDGTLGYVKKDEVDISGAQYSIDKEEETASPILTEGKINLIWEMTYSKSNIKLGEETPGIDVISPTWFEIVDKAGTIKNRATPEYVEYAHKNGWQVWALFSNSFSDIEGTSIILNNSDTRQEIIRSILAYAALYKLDGINLDFENMYKTDKDAYTQFVREFYPLAKEQGLFVSVDVSVPDGSDTWSKCYDRKALAESVDYICLMTYDQHWSTSPKAGSTAELIWVEENLQKTLNEVPANKLLLGIPLYTRLWTVDSGEPGSKPSSVALNVDTAWERAGENEAVVVWNDISGQYQATFEKEGKSYHMWIEDQNSVNMKTSLIHKYNLAGACVWAANFADKNVFNIFERNLKHIKSYEEWKTHYSEPIIEPIVNK